MDDIASQRRTPLTGVISFHTGVLGADVTPGAQQKDRQELTSPTQPKEVLSNSSEPEVKEPINDQLEETAVSQRPKQENTHAAIQQHRGSEDTSPRDDQENNKPEQLSTCVPDTRPPILQKADQAQEREDGGNQQEPQEERREYHNYKPQQTQEREAISTEGPVVSGRGKVDQEHTCINKSDITRTQNRKKRAFEDFFQSPGKTQRGDSKDFELYRSAHEKLSTKQLFGQRS